MTSSTTGLGPETFRHGQIAEHVVDDDLERPRRQRGETDLEK
jgi:hypothetical protein